MKSILKRSVLSAAMMLTAIAANAADWTPPGPIKLVIAFKAGGGVDTQARLIAEELEARHGWDVIPEQVTGKGGLNAVMDISEQSGDGTVITMTASNAVGYGLRSSGATSQDVFTAITTTAGVQMGIVSKTDKGWENLDDLIAAAKAGEEISFGAMSPMLGDLAYVIAKEKGVDFNIISMRGGKAVMNGLNAGDIDVGFLAGPQTKAVLAGEMVNLVSAMSEPLIASPEAKLLKDHGIEFTGEGFFTFLGPKNMDTEARDAIAAAIAEIVKDPETKAGALINKVFGKPTVIAGDDLAARLSADWDAAGALIEAAK
ncbi:MAG: tripartite tricarboxylate transporter substrate-binding protein [Rhodobacteraceae bacterium]|nr:tripartite tricarboxylate transporter substrate-binding protein [Paracoccaceae bacterium]